MSHLLSAIGGAFVGVIVICILQVNKRRNKKLQKRSEGS